MSLASLASVWKGDFATLWRTPPGWRDLGAAPAAPALPAVTLAWVNDRLAGAGLGDRSQPIRDRVWAYQVAQGLPPDGRLGPQTMMQLGRGVGPAEPALHTASATSTATSPTLER